jgi:hypothetical protein
MAPSAFADTETRVKTITIDRYGRVFATLPPLSENPSNCGNTNSGNNFYALADSDKMYAMVLAAYTTGRKIVVTEVHTGDCSGGFAVITGIKLEPKDQ